MSTLSPHRMAIGLPTVVALVSLVISFAGQSSSGSLAPQPPGPPLEARHLPTHRLTLGAPAQAGLAPAIATPPDAQVLRRLLTDRYVARLPFGREIRVAARRHAVDPLLVAAVVQAESSFRVDAVSPKGALGLMQLMPFHFDELSEPLDPATNLRIGSRYLARLEHRFDGDLELALAAYNAGPGSVERYGGIPPYRATRHYVDEVLANYRDHQRSVDRLMAGFGRAGQPQADQRGS